MSNVINTIESKAIYIGQNNIDTDQIIPAQFLKITDKAGLGKNAFFGWRYGKDGNPIASFPLNSTNSSEYKVLIAGDNFGCGSSREHAPWALHAWGLRVLISTSFADIFRNNALKNGILPITLPRADYEACLAQAQPVPNEPSAIGTLCKTPVSVDLAEQQLRVGKITVNFDIDAFSKDCLLRGVDQLGYILSFSDAIDQYEHSRSA